MTAIPQTYVANIFLAKPADYRKATQRVFHAGDCGHLHRAAGGRNAVACGRARARAAPVALPEKCMPQFGQFRGQGVPIMAA